MPLLYVLGAVTITLVSLISITGGTALPFVNATAPVTPPETPSPVFWLGILVVGNIAWRIACEAVVSIVRARDPPEHGEEEETPEGREFHPADEEENPGPVVCPHCGSTVQQDQIRKCENCGVVGCERCIKLTGLVRKKMTCKACFEST
jgi:hypothetical protein